MTKSKRVQPALEGEVQRRDCFQTPNYATKILLPYLPTGQSTIWEPACGKGKISRVLEKCFYRVISSDLEEYDEQSESFFKHDFLQGSWERVVSEFGVDMLVTNPPFSLKSKFWKKGLEIGLPFALLIPADYSGWLIEAFRNQGAQAIIPTSRINYITPSGLSEKTGQTSNFHSIWMTWGFQLERFTGNPSRSVYVDLTKEMKWDI